MAPGGFFLHVIDGLRRRRARAREIGQYTLEERLGSGGMAEVWRAQHRLLLRPAAVKIIRPDAVRSASLDPRVLRLRFEREARATASLKSPHVVQLYDFGVADDGTLYYVMELLEGLDLESLVNRYGPVPAERAIHILQQVCHALAEAHANGLIHRDIKPANIVVSSFGTDPDFVRVLDFGLVRLARGTDDGEDLRLTADGAASGTPAYMAPEIVLGESDYDHRVDLYSLGCVGYWLLTGKLVFDGDTATKVMFDHVRRPPVPPSKRTKLPIPPALEAIILECLEKDPMRRPASAAELAELLSACKVPDAWSAQRAQSWWSSYVPSSREPQPLADVLGRAKEAIEAQPTHMP